MKSGGLRDDGIRNCTHVDLGSCADNGPAGEPKQAGPDPETKLVAEGNNRFALQLYQKLQDDKGNLFFSPYSISTALAMTYAGARGATQEQMAQVLSFPTAKHVAQPPSAGEQGITPGGGGATGRGHAVSRADDAGAASPRSSAR